MTADQWIKQVYIDGRTHRLFSNKQIEESQLHQLYELAKIAPSASNLCPMRVSFVMS